MKNRIFFFAKFGELDKKPYGGGEVGNRRTKFFLENLGYEVVLIHRYCNYRKKTTWVYLNMIFGDFFSVAKMASRLFFKKRNHSVVHISGFTGKYMPLEFLAVYIAHLLRFKVVYEIRGGGIIDCYDKGNVLYKIMFRKTLNYANYIWSQGKENKLLIESNTKSPFFHYPNCVSEDFMPASCPQKPVGIIDIVYMGRINPSKNIDVIVQVANFLKQNMIKFNMNIIGDAEDFPEYLKQIEQYVKMHNLEKEVFFRGKLGKEDMIPFLEKAHFFLFPTEEKREGQSNSLTELMSFGVIPIATSQGYNRTIISCDKLIVDDITAESYGKKIIELSDNGQIEELSNFMYNRIKDNFTYSAVENLVKNEYSKIFNS